MDDAPVVGRSLADGHPFDTLWVASGISNLADGIGLTAAPLLAAALTRDPLLVSGLTIAQRLPWFLFTLISGALVDRLDRRRVMERANRWRFILLLGLAGMVLAGRVTLPILYLTIFLLGVIETLFDNAALAILPQIVEQEQLEDANGRLFAASTLANELIGPPIGSYLFSILQSTSFFIASLAYGLSSFFIHRIPGDFSALQRRPQGIILEIKEGVSWFWHHRLLRTIGLFAATFNLVFAATMGIFVLFSQEVLGLNAGEYGLLLATGAVGGILGSLLTRRLSDQIGAGLILLLDAVLSGLGFLGIGLTTRPLIVGLMLVLISLSDMFGNVIIISLRQAIIPPPLLGRVASAYRLLVLGALPLGAFIGGLLARTVNLAAPFLVGGPVLIIAGIAILPVVNNRAIRAAREAAVAGRPRE
jgi:predicted MFS family arabinose efflux permease